MNGEKFKTFISENFNITKFNIFLRLKDGQIKQLKSKFKNDTQIQNLNKIITDELKKYNSKTPKLYDTYKGKEEFFYLNANEVGEIDELKNINKYLDSNCNIESCSSYPGEIKYTIVEVFTEDRKFMFLTYYRYNQFFKKRIIGAFFNTGFSVEDDNEKNIIISFLPEVIIFEDEIIFSSSTVKVFDMDNIFKKCISNNLALVNGVFQISEIDKINKKQQTYLSRGIFNGNLSKFKNLSIDNKKNLLNKFKLKYKEKYNEEISINFTEGIRIIFDSLTPRQKEEIIKYTTNRSAYKVLDEQLTTSVD